jgi:hypothetical protein
MSQIIRRIECVLEYLNEDEDEVIEKELKEKYKEELGNFKECFDAVFMSKFFDKMKLKKTQLLFLFK